MGHSKTQQATIIALLALSSFASGCNDSGETGSIAAQPSELVEISGGDFCQDLLAGQTTDAGDVCLTVDGGDLVINYTTQDGWLLSETHLWAGTSIAEMPQSKKGNPKIGNFPYNSGSITPTDSYEVRVPLSEFGLTGDETECDPKTFHVAAHAVVGKVYDDGSFQTETGWAAGDRMVARGSWATFFSGEFTCTDDGGETGDKTCETAFAMSDVDATCFLDIDDDGDGKSDLSVGDGPTVHWVPDRTLSTSTPAPANVTSIRGPSSEPSPWSTTEAQPPFRLMQTQQDHGSGKRHTCTSETNHFRST